MFISIKCESHENNELLSFNGLTYRRIIYIKNKKLHSECIKIMYFKRIHGGFSYRRNLYLRYKKIIH